jgi:hypothetical protein
MRTLSLRPVLALTLAAALLSPVFACGNEKRLKECAARCESEGEECAHRKEKDCAERARKCAEECKR